MDIQSLTYLFVGISFGLYIFIAIKSRAGSTNEFYIAGKGIHPVANGMATAADWMSAASFISMAGLISFMGRDGAVYSWRLYNINNDPGERNNLAQQEPELVLELIEEWETNWR